MKNVLHCAKDLMMNFRSLPYKACIGLRYHLLGSQAGDSGHILENVIYLELLRRGYTVYVGKTPTSEIGFVTRDSQGSFA